MNTKTLEFGSELCGWKKIPIRGKILYTNKLKETFKCEKNVFFCQVVRTHQKKLCEL